MSLTNLKVTHELLLIGVTSPKSSIVSEELSANNISVTVEWTLEEGVEYNISVIPLAPVAIIENFIVQLILLYNTEYNVSLETFTACQREASSVVQLFYGEFNSQDFIY